MSTHNYTYINDIVFIHTHCASGHVHTYLALTCTLFISILHTYTHAHTHIYLRTYVTHTHTHTHTHSAQVMYVPGSGIRPFNFSRTFEQETSQMQVYKQFAQEAVVSAMNGFNACVLACESCSE